MKRWFELLIVAIIILLVIYVLKGINFREVYRLMKEVNMWFFILAFVSYFFILFLWDLTLYYSQNQIFKVKFLEFFSIFFTGCFFNTITPGAGVGGEPIRIYFLHKKYKQPISRSLGVILGDKFYHVSAFIVFALVSLIFLIFILPFSLGMKIFLWAVLFIVLFFTFLLLFFGLKKSKFNFTHLLKKIYYFKFIKNSFISKKEFEHSLNKHFGEFVDVFKSVTLSKKNFLIKYAFSFTAWGLTILVSYFLFLSLGISVNFLIVMIVVIIGYAIADISPIPGGIGLTESTMFLVYSALGVNPGVALVVSVLERFIYYFYTILIGGLCAVYLRLTV